MLDEIEDLHLRAKTIETHRRQRPLQCPASHGHTAGTSSAGAGAKGPRLQLPFEGGAQELGWA